MEARFGAVGQDSKANQPVKIAVQPDSKDPQPSVEIKKADTRAIATWFKQKSPEIKSVMASKPASEATFSAWDKALTNEKLPAAIIDMGALHRNRERLAAEAHGKDVRIATKSLRIPEVIQQVLDSGGQFKGLMCFSAEEAAYLHENNIGNDYLIAYPTVRLNNLRALRKMQEEGATVSLVVDSVEHMQAISAALEQIDRENDANADSKPASPKIRKPFRIVIDVDMSYKILGFEFGAKRSPIKTENDLRNVLNASKKFPKLEVVGAMGYEAVVAGLPDNEPATSLFGKIMNKIKSWLRKFAVPAIARKRAGIPAIFKETGCKLEIFNGGGTGSIDSAAKESTLTEVTVGSGLLCPRLFDFYTNLSPLGLEPAAFFAIEAGRFPDPLTVTCNGGGFVASGEVGQDRLPVAVHPKGIEPNKDEAWGEVQTPLKGKKGVITPDLLGHCVFARHAKAGELMKQVEKVHLFNGEEWVGTAPTYGARF